MNRFDWYNYRNRCLIATVCSWLAFSKNVLKIFFEFYSFISLFIHLFIAFVHLNGAVIAWKSTIESLEERVKRCHLNSFQNGFNFPCWMFCQTFYADIPFSCPLKSLTESPAFNSFTGIPKKHWLEICYWLRLNNPFLLNYWKPFIQLNATDLVQESTGQYVGVTAKRIRINVNWILQPARVMEI